MPGLHIDHVGQDTTDKSYQAPVLNLVDLANLSVNYINNKERRYVDEEGCDYFYDADANEGDLAPNDQVNNTGFWIKDDTNSIIKVDSIASLKALKNPAIKKMVIVLGYYAPGDGGGGEFYWDDASSEADNAGTIIEATNVANGRWKRAYYNYLNVRWFGAKGDGITDDQPFIQQTLLTASSNYIKTKVIAIGDFLLKNQLKLTDAPLQGVFGYTNFTIDNNFQFTDQISGRDTSCIFNTGYRGEFNFQANDLEISYINITCNLDFNSATTVLGLANVNSGFFNNLTIRVPAGRTSTVSGIDIRSCSKNMVFNYTNVSIENESNSGGGIWVRNITNDGSLAANNTENIKFYNCSVKQAAGDEAFAVYGVQGVTQNILASNCTFEALNSAVKHSVLVSAFPLNNGTANGAYAAVKDVVFDKCTFKDDYFTTHCFRSGQTPDSNNVCDGIKVQNSTFLVKKTVSETSYVARHITCIGNNNVFENNSIYSEGVQNIFYGINGFDVVRYNYLNENFNYGITNCNEVLFNELDNIKGIGVDNCTTIFSNKIKSGSHCITSSLINKKIDVQNNILENTNVDKNYYTCIYLKTDANALIKGNTLTTNSVQNYAVRRDGVGDVDIIGNEIKGVGKKILSANPLSKLKGNNWYGISDDKRDNPFLNIDYNRAVPLGAITYNTQVGSKILGWKKEANTDIATDWKAIYFTPPVENPDYNTLNAMYLDQAKQTKGYLQYVSGVGYFQYLGTTNGDASDYRLFTGVSGGTIDVNASRELNIYDHGKTLLITGDNIVLTMPTGLGNDFGCNFEMLSPDTGVCQIVGGAGFTMNAPLGDKLLVHYTANLIKKTGFEIGYLRGELTP